MHVQVTQLRGAVGRGEAGPHPSGLLRPVLHADRAGDDLRAGLGQTQLLGEPVGGHGRVGVRRGEPELLRWTSRLPRDDLREPRGPGDPDVAGPHLERTRGDVPAVVTARVEHGHEVHGHAAQRRVAGRDAQRRQARGQQLLLVVRGDDDADGADHLTNPSRRATLSAPPGTRTSSRKSSSSTLDSRGQRPSAVCTWSPLRG